MQKIIENKNLRRITGGDQAPLPGKKTRKDDPAYWERHVAVSLALGLNWMLKFR